MNSNFGLKASDMAAICSILKKYPAVTEVYIFGSRAKGNYKTGSDVDIALKGNGITLQTVSNVSFELNEETNMPYKFDVLNYHTIAEPALIEHIQRIGILFYKSENDI